MRNKLKELDIDPKLWGRIVVGFGSFFGVLIALYNFVGPAVFINEHLENPKFQILWATLAAATVAIVVSILLYHYAISRSQGAFRKSVQTEVRALLHRDGFSQGVLWHIRDYYRAFLDDNQQPLDSDAIRIEGSIIGFANILPRPLAQHLLVKCSTKEIDPTIKVTGTYCNEGRDGNEDYTSVALFPILFVVRTLQFLLEPPINPNLHGTSFKITWKPYGFIGASVIFSETHYRAILTRAMSEQTIDSLLKAHEHDKNFLGGIISEPDEVKRYKDQYDYRESMLHESGCPSEIWKLDFSNRRSPSLMISREDAKGVLDWQYMDANDNLLSHACQNGQQSTNSSTVIESKPGINAFLQRLYEKAASHRFKERENDAEKSFQEFLHTNELT